MGEILMAMYPGLEMPEQKPADLEPMKRSVALVKKAVKARGVKEAGADGIACSDALGPALRIDIRTGDPRGCVHGRPYEGPDPLCAAAA